MAEEKYWELYAKFRTHKFIDWGVLTQVQEEGAHTSVPPYSERFDEFLGFYLSGGSPVEVPLVMEKYFPEPDEIDCDYLEGILAELDKISDWGREIYMTYKGSKLAIGPGVCSHYAENIARAKKWVQSAREKLRLKQHLQILKPARKLKKQAASQDNASPWSGLFMNGFTIEKLTKLLIVLGVLTEDREYTADSKPRKWRAVIEALRDNKRLIRTDAPRIHKALITEFGEGAGSIPSPRTIQDAFAPKNADVKQLYKQADAWLKAN